MAHLPTSLGLPQPNISDGSDLLRMAAMLSRESSETANKAFDDFKSTMITSANNDLASTFANGIANGLSPDEAFKQATGTINSWTSADAINSALHTRNAEKDAILRANQDRRAEAFENRQKLDWEGANKAAEANNLFDLAHATNNMNLFKQAEALTQGYDDITKKHVKPTEMATLQDSLATNALQRAKLQAELDNAKQDRLAKEAQSWFKQYRDKHPEVSSYEALAKTAQTFGIDPEALQRIGLFYDLSMGTETSKELADTIIASTKFTDTDAQNKANWLKALNDLNVTLDEANSLMITPDAKLSESEKANKQQLVNMLSGNIEADMKDLSFGELTEYAAYTTNSAGLGPKIMPKPEDFKQFTNALLQTKDKKSRDALIDSFANQYVMADTVKSKINTALNKNFKYTDDSPVSLSDTAFTNFSNALNNQDLGGTTREEQRNIYKLAQESLALKQASAENNKLKLMAQQAYKNGKYNEGDQLMKAFNENNLALQERAKQYQTKFAVANSGNSLVTAYANYQPLIEGKEGFDIPTLTKKFGEDRAKSMEDTYQKTIKELNKTPSLQIPDKAIRLAIIQNPNETDEDDIIKQAKVLKGTMAGIANSSGVMSSLFDFWSSYSDAFNLPH